MAYISDFVNNWLKVKDGTLNYYLAILYDNKYYDKVMHTSSARQSKKFFTKWHKQEYVKTGSTKNLIKYLEKKYEKIEVEQTVEIHKALGNRFGLCITVLPTPNFDKTSSVAELLASPLNQTKKQWFDENHNFYFSPENIDKMHKKVIELLQKKLKLKPFDKIVLINTCSQEDFAGTFEGERGEAITQSGYFIKYYFIEQNFKTGKKNYLTEAKKQKIVDLSKKNWVSAILKPDFKV